MSEPSRKRNALTGGDESSATGRDVSCAQSYDHDNSRLKLMIPYRGRILKDKDFHNIQQFLQLLFLKAPVNLSDMSSVLINQSNLSTVIKQCDYGNYNVDGCDIFDDQLFGVTSILNITQQTSECVGNVRKLMLDLSKQHGDSNTMKFVHKLLSDDKNQVGLLINERYLNLPPSVSVPLFQSMRNELSSIKTENPFNNFAYLFMICKLYKVKNDEKGNRYFEGPEILWRNVEEQFFDVAADCKFEYCVQSEDCIDSERKWIELNDPRMIPLRRVLIFSMEKFYLVTKKLESFLMPEDITFHSANRFDN